MDKLGVKFKADSFNYNDIEKKKNQQCLPRYSKKYSLILWNIDKISNIYIC